MDEIKQLNEIGQIITGNTPKTSDERNYNSNDICFVKPSDMEESKLVTLTDTEAHIAEYARSKARILPKRSVLVTCIGIIGKVAVNEMECAFNQQINAIIPDEKICHYKFLGYALLAKRKMIQDMANAPVVPILNKSQFSNVKIKVPSIKEQLRMVSCLETVDKLIDKRKQEIEKLDELVKSRFIEMFGDLVINSKNYPIRKLSDYIDSLTSGSRGWAKYFDDNGKEWFITIKNVKDGKILMDNMQKISPPNNAEARRTKVKNGDLLISITADLGRTAVVSDDIEKHGAYINQHLTCVRLNKNTVNPKYISFYLESEAGKRQFEAKNQSAVKAGLNFNAIKNLLIVVPSLEEQNQFVDFRENIDKSKLAIQKSMDDLETLKKSLMQQYFG